MSLLSSYTEERSVRRYKKIANSYVRALTGANGELRRANLMGNIVSPSLFCLRDS